MGLEEAVNEIAFNSLYRVQKVDIIYNIQGKKAFQFPL